MLRYCASAWECFLKKKFLHFFFSNKKKEYIVVAVAIAVVYFTLFEFFSASLQLLPISYCCFALFCSFTIELFSFSVFFVSSRFHIILSYFIKCVVPRKRIAHWKKETKEKQNEKCIDSNTHAHTIWNQFNWMWWPFPVVLLLIVAIWCCCTQYASILWTMKCAWLNRISGLPIVSGELDDERTVRCVACFSCVCFGQDGFESIK